MEKEKSMSGNNYYLKLCLHIAFILFFLSMKEKEKLQATVGTLKQNLAVSQESTGLKDGSMTIMKQSFAQLKERLDKKEKKIRALEKTIATLEVQSTLFIPTLDTTTKFVIMTI